METIRKRFMTPRSKRAAIIPETDDEYSQLGSANASQPKDNDSNLIVLHLSPSKRIVMSSNGSVTLFDKVTATVVSTSENPATKILALESINDLLGQNNDRDLDPNRESPVVAQIIRTFENKKGCLDAIDRCCFDVEHRRVLGNWASDSWEEDAPEDGEDSKVGEDEPDSPAGSLFSDSDVQELPNNRVRPITLRPRRPAEQDMSARIKSEKPPSSFSSKSSSGTTSAFLSRSRQSSPPRRIRDHSPKRLEQSAERLTLKARTTSSPTLRHKTSRISLRDKYRPDYSKKRPHLTIENVSPEDCRVKRVKSHNILPQAKSPATAATKKATAKRSQEKLSLAEVLSPIRQRKGMPEGDASESNAEYVSRYWKATASQFPESVRELSTVDRLAYYFRESDLMRKELQIIKRDEAERRKSMLLMAEKIKLMNEPVVRGTIGSAKDR